MNRSTSSATRGFQAIGGAHRITDPTGEHLRDPITGKSLGGRKPGSKNQISSEARQFALDIVRSPEYRASLLTRVKAGTLAPNIEAMLWAYAYGKPAERIVIDHNPAAELAELPVAQLAERAELIAKVLREVGDINAAELALQMVDEAEAERRAAPIDVTPTKVEDVA